MKEHEAVQHLRELMDSAEIVTPVHYWQAKGEIVGANGKGLLGCDIAEAPAVVAAINAIPALLAVAEAARAYMKHKFPNGDQSSMVTFSMQMHKLTDDLLDAIAKLDEVKQP